MDKLIYIDHQKCVGCATCEMVCSLVHEGICSPSLSRIRVVRYPTQAFNVPITCAFCEFPPVSVSVLVGPLARMHKTVRLRSTPFFASAVANVFRPAPLDMPTLILTRVRLLNAICVGEIRNVLNTAGPKPCSIYLWKGLWEKRGGRGQKHAGIDINSFYQGRLINARGFLI